VRDSPPVTVLGIDPGTAITGYGIVRKEGRNPLTLIECGVIRTRPRDDLARRLVEIHEGVLELIRRHKPTVLSIEDIFYARNVRTTVVLGHARGAILLAAAHQFKDRPYEGTPPQNADAHGKEQRDQHDEHQLQLQLICHSKRLAARLFDDDRPPEVRNGRCDADHLASLGARKLL